MDGYLFFMGERRVFFFLRGKFVENIKDMIWNLIFCLKMKIFLFIII